MRIANRDCGGRVARRQPFTGSNLRGGPRGTVGSFGSLSPYWQGVFCGDDPDYVVWPYDTPIVWHGSQGWVVPPVRYSPTTDRHLWHVARGLPS